MMEENNIEMVGGGIVCDNNTVCDYNEPNVKFEDMGLWLDKPCPKCGTNLLTKEDLENACRIRAVMEVMNQLTPEQIIELGGGVDIESIKNSEVFKDAKGLEFLASEGEVTMTVKSHKGIKVMRIAAPAPKTPTEKAKELYEKNYELAYYCYHTDAEIDQHLNTQKICHNICDAVLENITDENKIEFYKQVKSEINNIQLKG